MDPVTTAIVIGTASGVARATTTQVYSALKRVLARKFGSESKIVRAVESVETQPNSKNRQDILAKQVQLTQADKDAEVLAAAKALRNKINSQSDEAKTSQ